jgi:hypothetical protein
VAVGLRIAIGRAGAEARLHAVGTAA